MQMPSCSGEIGPSTVLICPDHLFLAHASLPHVTIDSSRLTLDAGLHEVLAVRTTAMASAGHKDHQSSGSANVTLAAPQSRICQGIRKSPCEETRPAKWTPHSPG